MRRSNFILIQIKCANSDMHAHATTTTPPPSPSQTSQPLISLDETRLKGVLDGDNNLLTETERRGREGGSSCWGLLELCVLWPNRDGMVYCCKGREDGLELRGGCVTLFWWGYSCCIHPAEFQSFSKFKAWASAVNHNFSDVFQSIIVAVFYSLLGTVASLNKCNRRIRTREVKEFRAETETKATVEWCVDEYGFSFLLQ